MNRISETFAKLRERGNKALIPYLTAGFPTIEATAPLLKALADGGADIIELGVPFSDPIADGPTIQRASGEALAGGVTVPKVLEMVRQFRQTCQTPIVLFGAYNPFFHYGIDKFMRDAASAGADAMIVPDLPPEEAGEIRGAVEAAGLILITFVTPTTPPQRAAELARTAKGFIYYISVKGVTGARTGMKFQLAEPIAQLRKHTSTPVAVGFGIARPEQAREVTQVADAAVVGSALIDFISRNRDASNLPEMVRDFIRSFRQAMQ